MTFNDIIKNVLTDLMHAAPRWSESSCLCQQARLGGRHVRHRNPRGASDNNRFSMLLQFSNEFLLGHGS